MGAIAELVLPSKARIGRAYKLAPTSAAIDVATPFGVDTSAMTVSATISTPAKDRASDILIPAGCDLTNYRTNPVVYWEHGLQLTLPIAKSEDAGGNLTVGISEAAITATAWFTHKVREAAQIFELIADGFIRATSVRMRPIKSRSIRDGDETAYVIDAWELEEWSFVGIGCNPEALAGVVAKGRLAGGKIADPILKSLMARMPKRKPQSNGIGPGASPMAKAAAKSKPKAAPPDDEAPETEPAVDETAETEPAKTEPAADEMPDTADTANVPYGAQVTAGVHSRLADLAAEIEAGMGPLENVAIKEALTGLGVKLQECLAEVEGAFASAYPDRDALKVATDKDAEADAEALKSLLSASAGPRHRITGLGVRLKSLAKDRNLTVQQRATITTAVGLIGGMVNEARALKSAPEPNENDAKQLAELTAIKAQFAALQNKLAAVIPAAK